MGGKSLDTTNIVARKPLEAYTNILGLRLNKFLKRTVIHNFPIFAYVEPTITCNLRCPACPTGLQLNLRPALTIDFEQYRGLLDEVGDYLFELHMYNWGEPLLYKRTPEMIRLAKAKAIHVRLSSNLSMTLTDDTIEALVSSGLDTLVVSLDGASAETYQQYRRRGDFERVCENMRRIQSVKARLKRPSPTVVCQFLVFRHNEHEIATVRREYRNLGADRLVIEGAQMPFAAFRGSLEPSTDPVYNVYHAEHRHQREARRQMASGRACSWLYGGLVLNPGGKVSPCCASPSEADDFGDYDAGRGFLAVWNNEHFQAARRLFTSPSADSRSAGVPLNMERNDGMGMHAHTLLKKGQLICQQCPIPFRQDEADRTIARITRTLLAHFWNPRCIAAFILMGGINQLSVRRAVQVAISWFSRSWKGRTR